MQNKTPIIISVIAVLVLSILLIGATFAYFQAQGNTGSITETKVTTYTTDTLSFETGNPLTFTIDQENFASGKGNLSSNTYAKAILTANNKTNTATEHYYLYLNIAENTFSYTQNENTPEILLTIKDASGTELTSINGLVYKTVTDGKGATIKGFDITIKNGLIALLNNREITATPTKTDEWNITITFVNYDANQSANAGNSFSAKLMVQKEEQKPSLADYVISQYTGTQGENSLYYHDANLTNGTGDNSYRYAGASNNVNNYICLGSTTATCSDDNLFRIIGVFGEQVKVIRAQSIGAQNWNSISKNTWETSSLNTYLNGEYLTNLGTLADKITTTTWKISGGTYANIRDAVPKTAYQYEVKSSTLETYDAKIGLMYVSDYYYGASPNMWTLVGYTGYNGDATKDYRAATSENWLFLGATEWTITRQTNNQYNSYAIYNTGYVNMPNVNYEPFAVRPTFNLESSVTYKSGSGTQSDPIIIK